MQSVKYCGLSHPISNHLEPEEALNSSVKVEFSVVQIPCVPDPKVSCYKNNGCIVFEGYCPVDSQIPFTECGIRNSITDSEQQDTPWSQETGETETPYNPLALWDVIPRLIHDIISGPGAKVRSMDDKKLPPGVKNLPTGSFLHDDPEKPSGSGNISAAKVAKHSNQLETLEQVNEQRIFHTERDQTTMIFPLITGIDTSGGSSIELSIAPDPFVKRLEQNVGNFVDPKTPVSQVEALPDGEDLVTERKWERRGALPMIPMPEVLTEGTTAESALPTENRVTMVLSAYTKSGRLHRRTEEDPSEEDTDSVSVSILETDSGGKGVGPSDIDIYNSTGSPEGGRSHADAACGTGRIDGDDSQCILCGSSLRHRKRDQRTRYTEEPPAPGQPSRPTLNLSSHASRAGHTQHPKERNMRQEVTAYPAISNQGQTSKAMMGATAEYRHHARQEITAHHTKTSSSKPLNGTVNAGTSTIEEAQKLGKKHTEMPKTFGNQQNVAVYTMSHVPSSTSISKTKKDDDKTCTMQHILFPKDACPYTPSLTSLPLDESDIEYIIRRAQLARSALPPEEWACPTERWQHRQPSGKSPHSRSSG